MENHRNPRLEQLATGTVFDTKRIYGRNGNIIDRYDSCQRDSTLVFFFCVHDDFFGNCTGYHEKEKKNQGTSPSGMEPVTSRPPLAGHFVPWSWAWLAKLGLAAFTC